MRNGENYISINQLFPQILATVILKKLLPGNAGVPT